MTVLARLHWTAAAYTRPASEALADRHRRTFDYLRMALMERCNSRYAYCLPEAALPLVAAHKLLRANELPRTIAVGAALNGTGRESMTRIGD